MSTPSDSIKITTIIYSTVGVAFLAAIGYATYFDYKRRNDTDFRRALKRESKRQVKAAKEQAESERLQYENQIRIWVDEYRAEPVSASAKERDERFMEEVSMGERLCADPSSHREAAFAFFKALTNYARPSDLMSIYDKTVPKEVLDILAEMIAYDRRMYPSGSSSASGGGVE